MPKFSEWRIKVGLNCSSNSAKPTETIKYNVLELAPVELHEKLTFLYKTKNIEMFWSYITSNNKQNETTTVPTISDTSSVAGC